MARGPGPARFVALLAAALTASCGGELDRSGGPLSARAPLDEIAERYVQLALAFRPYDESYVDAYYGPPAWAEEAVVASEPLDSLHAAAELALARLEDLDMAAEPDIVRARADGLAKRYRAMRLRMEMATGRRVPFDEESRILFDAQAPAVDDAGLRAAVAAIEALLPGEGRLGDRVNAFRDQFTIPTGRLEAVFDAAIAECRRRTLTQIDLPAGESFTIEYVTDQPWSGYNWYQGESRSLIQINTDLPIYIDRAVDLGCHEGYPGHHTYSVLAEQALVDGRGWIEFALVPLYGPMSLISEGSANYGVELAFPDEERRAFERDVLFPLAGLDADRAARYHDVRAALDALRYADIAVAREYLDGRIPAAQAVARLQEFALVSEARAAQRVRFFDTYRSYVINYSFGEDLVAEYLTARAGADQDARWRAFAALLSRPMSPGAMR